MESHRRLCKMGSVMSVVETQAYHENTLAALGGLLDATNLNWSFDSIGELLHGNTVLELAAGPGRNVEVYRQYQPRKIELLDVNNDHMVQAAKLYGQAVTTHTSDIFNWVTLNQDRSFDVVLGVWTLCYMSEQDVDVLLRWCKRKVGALVLVEPVVSGDLEYWVDSAQQMVGRPVDCYLSKLEAHNFTL